MLTKLIRFLYNRTVVRYIVNFFFFKYYSMQYATVTNFMCLENISISWGSNISKTTVLEMLVYDISAKPHGKESACNAGDLGLIPGSGRSPGEGNSNPLQYSCLENPMEGGVWQALCDHGVIKVGHDRATSLRSFMDWSWSFLHFVLSHTPSCLCSRHTTAHSTWPCHVVSMSLTSARATFCPCSWGTATASAWHHPRAFFPGELSLGIQKEVTATAFGCPPPCTTFHYCSYQT